MSSFSIIILMPMLMLYMPRFHVGTLNIFLLLCYAMPSYVRKLKNFAIDHQKINKIETRPKVYIYLRRGSLKLKIKNCPIQNTHFYSPQDTGFMFCLLWGCNKSSYLDDIVKLFVHFVP